ncbi:MAG TPA: Wzz/FepE/Etk N-terminal domain-containing protein [Bryobacteraceae bacterium]|nr:Wzz/FepE/Etk N-terminal domain-containing protein [Bryobacteraceae bacterium]
MVNNTQTALDESESGNPAFSLLSILRTVWKRKVRITLVWVLLATVGFAVVRLLPAVYLSEAVVLIDTQKIPEKFVSATVASDVEERIAAIRQTLLSGGELKKIIDDFGLYREERKTHFDEEILEMMRKDITITLESVGSGSNDKRTASFRIGFQGRDPVLVTRVANRLTDLYVEQNLKTREGQAEGTSEFLDTQLLEAKKRLDQLEGAVSSYKLQHNGELPEQEQSLASTLSRLQTELEANRDAINRTQQTKVIQEGNLSAMEVTLGAQTRAWEQAQHPSGTNEPFSLPGQPATATQKKASEVLQEQLEVLRGRYSDNHPDVIRLRAEIEKVKRVEEQRKAASSEDVAKSAPATGGASRDLPPAREPVEFAHTREQVAGLKAQIKGSDKELEDRKAEQQRILRDLDQYQRRIERLPVREQEMAQITRDYEMSKANYKSLLDKKMAAEMALDMERRQQSERFTVLDRAQLPEKPIKPKRPVLYAAALGVGLVIALVMGFGAELRQNVFLGEWELPAGTPVLARLPYIHVPVVSGQTNSRSRGRWFSRRKGLANASVILLFLAGGSCLNLFLHRL